MSAGTTRPILGVVVLLFCVATNAECTLEVLKPLGSSVLADGRTIDLGEADQPKNPSAWQGPLRVDACSLDMGIIEEPLVFVAPKFLYVATYSGSNRMFRLVDLDRCSMKWKSRQFSGGLDVTKRGIWLGGQQVRLNQACLPR